jgi:hypothetical protein
MCKTDVSNFGDHMGRGLWKYVQSSAIFLYTYRTRVVAGSILNNLLLIRLHDQIVVFRMTFEPDLYEGAINFYGQMIGAGILEGIFGECTSDTVAAELFGHLGMHEDNLAVV